MTVVGDADIKGDFLERTVTPVPEELLRDRVVGHEEVRPRVTIVVIDSDPEPFPGMRTDARVFADVAKGSITLVVVEKM